MDLLTLRIPLGFATARAGSLTWSEVLFGIENELLDPEAARQLAELLLDQPEASAEVLELAIIDKGEPVLERVRDLARTEREHDDSIREKWLFLALSWLFEHRSDLPDPLQAVEIAYADFGYPEAAVGFVRYMPSDAPDAGSTALGERGLYESWQRFLEEQGARFRRNAP